MKTRGNPVVLADFDQQERDLAMYMACIYNNEKEARELNEKPAKFEVNKWIKREEKIFGYLSSVYNTREVPLSYVVRKDHTGDVADMTRKE